MSTTFKIDENKKIRSIVPVGKDVTQNSEPVNLGSYLLTKLLELERVLLSIFDDANNKGINSMTSDFIAEQEKQFECYNLG